LYENLSHANDQIDLMLFVQCVPDEEADE